MWSSPITSAPKIGNVVNTYEYIETAPTRTTVNGSGWVRPTGNMVPGKGYMATAGNVGSLQDFTGTINNANTSNISVPVTLSAISLLDPTNYDGWNLLGNPFASTISFNTFMAANGSAINTGGISYYDGTNYQTLVSGSTIAVGQGFFVKAIVASGTVVFNNSMRTAGTNPMLRTDGSVETLKIQLQTGSLSDNTFVQLSEGATDGYDSSLDFPKIKGNDILQLYSKLDGISTAFSNNQLAPGDDKRVQLAYDAKNAGTYFISLVENSAGLPVLLEDFDLSTTFDLSKGAYTFTSDGTVDDQRFVLHISPTVASVAGDLSTSTSIYVTAKDKEVSVKGLTDLDVRVIDLNGKLVATGKGNGTCVIDMTKSPAGLYIVGVNGTFTRKVIIQ